MGSKDHKESAEGESSARCAIVTVSDSRTPDSDTSGKEAFAILTKFGHSVVRHDIVPNKPRKIAAALGRALKGADLVLTIGGTGISRKDLSTEVVRKVLQKELPGFGEIFRALSLKEIGTAAILSRALLGVTSRGKIVAALPGSGAAVRLALEAILLPELKHLLWELRRYS